VAVAEAEESGGAAAQTPPGPESDQLHVTVTALPNGSGDSTLAHEVGLVKAALLYADRVTLASPTAVLQGGVAQLADPDPRVRRENLIRLVAEIHGPEFETEFRRLQAVKHPSRQDLIRRGRLERLLDEQGQKMAESVAGSVDGESLDELAAAIEAGVLEINPLGIDEESDPATAIETMMDGLATLLRKSLDASSTTLPLLDTAAGDLVEAMIRGRQIFAAETPAAEIGAAGRVLQRLEAFPEAEVLDILDVRQRLSLSLVRFRGAMAESARRFEATAWDPGFAAEVENYRRAVVEPAVQEVDEGLRELDVGPTLRRLSKSDHTARAGGLLVTLAVGTSLADLPALLLGSAAKPLLQGAAEEARFRHQQRTDAERNSFYFLYEADRSLAVAS
jgi:hypothetical protein